MAAAARGGLLGRDRLDRAAAAALVGLHLVEHRLLADLDQVLEALPAVDAALEGFLVVRPDGDRALRDELAAEGALVEAGLVAAVVVGFWIGGAARERGGRGQEEDGAQEGSTS